MEPTEGYSFSSHPEMSAEQERQKKLGQISTWTWEVIENFSEEDHPGEATRPATKPEDHEKGLRGDVYLLDRVNTFIIDYSATDPFNLVETTLQRFILTTMGGDLYLSATPPLPDITVQESLTHQMEEDEFVDIVTQFQDFIERNLQPASTVQVEELLELMARARVGDLHLDGEDIDNLLPGETL